MKAEYFDACEQVTATLNELRGALNKPLIGGHFGSGRFMLTSVVHTVHGLHEVWFFVRDAGSRAVISFGRTKPAALATARDVLTLMNNLDIAQYLARVQARRNEAAAEWAKAEREAAEEFARIRRSEDKVRSIPRRRKQIFDECAGKCHYCDTELTLDGKWHIEHKMPKALGGGNEPGNLVASCVSCNQKKRDTTDVEFRARLAKESA